MIMRYRNTHRHEIKWKNNAHLVFDNYDNFYHTDFTYNNNNSKQVTTSICRE